MSQHIDPTPKQTDLTALNSKMTDTGWVVLDSKLSYRKINQTVYVFINVPSNSLTTSWNAIGTLPAGCRPSTALYDMCFRSVDNNVWMNIVVSDQGIVSVMGANTGSLTTQYTFCT